MNNMSYQTKSFMWEELSLGGVELLVYSVIYSFSQGECVGYYGTQNTLGRVTGLSISTIKRVLSSLIEKGLIEKTQTAKGCIYRCKGVEPEEEEPDTSTSLLALPDEVIRENGIPLTSKIIKSPSRARSSFLPVGSLGVLSMTAGQYNELLSLVDEETLSAYIHKLEKGVVNKGYSVNSAYKTLRKWIAKDTRV